MVADLHHFDDDTNQHKKPDPEPYQSEKSDPDPREKSDMDTVNYLFAFNRVLFV
jgi:hypothetical protein